MLKIIKVVGHSMWPTLRSGDFVVLRTVWPRIAPGALVVVDHPVAGQVIKRVKSVTLTRGQVQLSSDNASVVSVATEGLVDRTFVKGSVIFCIRATGERLSIP